MTETLSPLHEEKGEIDFRNSSRLAPYTEENFSFLEEDRSFPFSGKPLWAIFDLVRFSNEYILRYAHTYPTSIWEIEFEEPATQVEMTRMAPGLLAAIRARFPMSTSDLSRIFRVERPTIYSWMRGEAEPRQGNRRRLLKIAQLSDRWAELSSRPMENIKSIRVEGSKSLFDLLTEDPLRDERIRSAMERLVREAATPAEQQAREASPSLADAARARGMERISDEERGWNLRFLGDRDH